jgi:hypothetical protein
MKKIFHRSNSEIRNFDSSPNSIRGIISRIMRWMGYVARMKDVKKYNTLVSKPQGKRSLEAHKR